MRAFKVMLWSSIDPQILLHWSDSLRWERGMRKRNEKEGWKSGVRKRNEKEEWERVVGCFIARTAEHQPSIQIDVCIVQHLLFLSKIMIKNTMDQKIHPSMWISIDSVKINPSLLMMRERCMQYFFSHKEVFTSHLFAVLFYWAITSFGWPLSNLTLFFVVLSFHPMLHRVMFF